MYLFIYMRYCLKTNNITISVSKFSAAPPALNTRSKFKGKLRIAPSVVREHTGGTIGDYEKSEFYKHLR